MVHIFAILVLALVLLPMILGGLRRGRPTSLVVLGMLIYGVLSIHFAGTETQSAQYWLLIAAIVFLVYGRYFILSSRLADKLQGQYLPRPKLDISINTGRLWLVAGTGFAFTGFLFATHGIPLLSGNSLNSRLDILSNGYLGTLAVAPLNVALIVLLITVEFKKQSFQISTLKLIGAIIIFGTLWLYANRGMAIFPLLTVGAFYFIKYPKYLIRGLLAALGAVLLVGYAGYKRNFEAWGIGYDIDLASRGFEGFSKYLAPVVEYTVGTSEALNIILHSIPDHVPHPLGSIFFSALASPLPGTQPTAGAFLKDIAGVDFAGGGLAMGSIGGLYIDFGIVGVILGFAVAGIMIGIFESNSLTDVRWTVCLAWTTGHLILMNYAHPIPNIATLLVPFILYWVTKNTVINDQSIVNDKNRNIS